MRTFLVLIILLGTTAAQAQRGGECPLLFAPSVESAATLSVPRSALDRANTSLSKKEIKRRRAEMFAADKDLSAPIERRPKMLVSGEREDAVVTIDPADQKIDFADPSLTMPITYPNGVTKYRINASGLRYIEANSPDEFFRGGVFKVQHSRGFYPDGSEMTGAYHNEAWSWDVVTYKNAEGETIAFGGTMKQPEGGGLPNVSQHNFSRSRWWGYVRHVPRADGTYEERILWQGPIHDFNRGATIDWDMHGYGGTLMTKWNPKTKIHEPVRLKNGNYLMFYERVTEQKRLANDRLVPYVTTMFAREIDPSLKNAVGPETGVTEMISKATGTYFEATKRGLPHEDEGFLAEGGNVFINDDGMILKAFSGNDYVGRYGIYLDYLPKGRNPKSKFIPVTDAKGELVDFAAEMGLRKLMHGTWLGRPQLEKAPDGKIWMKFHFVPIESIPKGAPLEGWPTAEQLLKYGRVTAMAPIKITKDSRGQPRLELDSDKKKFVRD